MDISNYQPTNQLARNAQILRLLFGNAGNGLTPTEIARACGISASYVTQQLGQLANLRMAEEVGDTGRWRPGIAWAQMATSFHLSIKRDLDSLTEYQQRSTRSAY